MFLFVVAGIANVVAVAQPRGDQEELQGVHHPQVPQPKGRYLVAVLWIRIIWPDPDPLHETMKRIRYGSG